MVKCANMVVYYNVDDTISSDLNFGTSLIQTKNGYITDKVTTSPDAKKIGTYSIYNVVYDLPSTIHEQGTFDSTNQNSFFLPNGTILCTSCNKVLRNSKGVIIFPAGSVNVKRIISGTGKYISKTGYVIITAAKEDGNRIVKFYFTKNK